MSAQGEAGTAPASEGGTPSDGLPSPGAAQADGAWLTVALLCLLIGASFLDRNIIALLVDPIRADLGISDSLIGLLFGAGFAIFYVVAGIPLAHFADHGSRKRLLIFGVTLWSLTTLAAAFAMNFTFLAIARAGVAIGEAVLTPVAISLIADLFPRGKRSLPTSLYLTCSGMMGAASPILGGAAYAFARGLSESLDIEAWRLTFIIVAVPGLLLAAIYALLVREPARQHDLEEEPDHSSMAATFGHFFRNFALFGTVFLGVGIMLINAMAISAWGPTMLIREHDFSPAQAGLAMGSASLAGALIGGLSVPFAVKFLPGRTELRRIMHAIILFPLVGVPIMALTVASSNLPLALVGVAAGIVGVVSGPVLAPILIQTASPANMRARMTAFYLTFNILISLGLGPVLVPMLSHVRPDRPIGGALTFIAWGTLVIAMASYAGAARTVQRRP